MPQRLDIVILGLSVTSSWGNGHATCYRGLMKALAARGHRVLFLERDVPWYAAHRDQPRSPFGRIRLYATLDELREAHAKAVRLADVVIVGSFIPDGIEVGRWVLDTAEGVTAFYDIDTPVTLDRLEAGTCEYLESDLIERFDLYLSFTGGPTLKRLERVYGARRARALYCSVDPDLYFPEDFEPEFDLGYMGTYSPDRQPTLEQLLLQPALKWNSGRFAVVGPMYPLSVNWPENVVRREHLPPAKHRAFYCSQRFTLNVTRAEMIRAGYSPSVRLFEAAACGTPIVSDAWAGLDEVFEPGREILVARSRTESLRYLRDMSETERRRLGARARRRVLGGHTCHHRARQLERFVKEVRTRQPVEV